MRRKNVSQLEHFFQRFAPKLREIGTKTPVKCTLPFLMCVCYTIHTIVVNTGSEIDPGGKLMCIFDRTKLEDSLSFFSVFNITDPRIHEVKDFLATEYPDALAATTEELTADIKESIANRAQASFYDKYMAPQMLIVEMDRPVGEALQLELTIILSGRRMKENARTIFLSSEPVGSYVTETALRTLTRANGSIRVGK